MNKYLSVLVLILALISISYLFWGDDKPRIEYKQKTVTPTPTIIPCNNETECKG
jgi:hypothetical protein